MSLDKTHQEEMESLDEIKEAAETSPLKDILLVLGGGLLGQIKWVFESHGVAWTALLVISVIVLLVMAYFVERR